MEEEQPEGETEERWEEKALHTPKVDHSPRAPKDHEGDRGADEGNEGGGRLDVEEEGKEGHRNERVAEPEDHTNEGRKEEDQGEHHRILTTQEKCVSRDRMGKRA